MYTVLVIFKIIDGEMPRFLERMQQQARDSLELEPECQRFDVCVDPGDSQKVLLYEIYENKAAFESHLESDHFKSFDHDVAEIVVDRKIEIYHKLP